MKYIKFIGIAALAMAFAACDDIEESSSLPQTNPQLPGVDASNVKVTAGTGVSGVIDLTAVNDADGLINVAKVNTPEDWPEGFTPNVSFMQFASSDKFEDAVSVKASMGAEGEVFVDPDDWEEAFKAIYGKSPEQQSGYVRFPVFAVKDTQSVRMGGGNTWYNTMAVTVKPFNIFGHIIEENYYIVGSFCNWNVANAIKMTHSQDYNQYDDPHFNAVINVTGAGFEFAFIPESTVASGNVNTYALGGEYAGIVIDPAAESNFLLATQGAAPNFMIINDANPYQVKLNMETMTFAIQTAYTQLYTPGDSNNWQGGASQTLTTDNYTWYSGYAHLSGGFKITTAPDWSGVNYGVGETEGTLSTKGDNNNINVEKDALYYVTVDLSNTETPAYTLTEITSIGVIGDATDLGWDGQTNLQHSADFLTWSAEVTLKAGEFKFRMNDDWGINLGGDMNDLKANGDNLASPGEGTYIITLNLGTHPYFCTVVPK